MERENAEIYKRLTMLEAEFKHVVRDIEHAQLECDRKLDEARKVNESQQIQINENAKKLMAYDRMALKGGSFALGFLALGVMMSEQLEKIVKKILGVLP